MSSAPRFARPPSAFIIQKFLDRSIGYNFSPWFTDVLPQMYDELFLVAVFNLGPRTMALMDMLFHPRQETVQQRDAAYQQVVASFGSIVFRKEMTVGSMCVFLHFGTLAATRCYSLGLYHEVLSVVKALTFFLERYLRAIRGYSYSHLPYREDPITSLCVDAARIQSARYEEYANRPPPTQHRHH